MWRIPALAEQILVVHIIFLSSISTDITVDKDVEEGRVNERNTFLGQGRGEYGEKMDEFKKIQKEKWWANRTCSKGYSDTLFPGCPETRKQKCFGIEISYSHRVETDEPFPHWAEFLQHFPKCWSMFAPLVCFVHYRPCDTKGDQRSYNVFQLFPTELCNEMRSNCEFAFRHFPAMTASYLNCDEQFGRLTSTNLRGNDDLQQKSNDSSLLVYNEKCKLDLTSSSRRELVQLVDLAKSCLTPLVYVNGSEENQRTHALPLVDNCYIPCSSTIYDAHSLSFLRVFSFVCFFLVLLFAFQLISRAKLIFDFGIFICFLAIVSTFLIALTFALSPFLGNGVVCLLDGKIRRFSGASSPANGNDILCMMEATYLKVCLVFAFWTSFIIMCNEFRNEFRAKSLFFQQFSALCHILSSLFVTLWHREISIDPVPKVCHYFHFHSVWLIFVDFVLLLLVAFFILFLSKAKNDFKNNGKKGPQMDQMLVNETLNDSFLPDNGKNDAKLRANEAMVRDEQGQLSFLQRFVDGLTRQISPLFLLFAYFGCVLSFYPLAEMDESDLLSAQINCSLSALSNDRWKGNEHLENCRVVPRIPFWHYANSLAVVFHLALTLCVVSGYLTKLHKSKNDGVTKSGEEAEDYDNKNEFEMDTLENGEREERRRTNGPRTNPSSSDSNCRASVADSMYSNGYAAIDSSTTNSILHNVGRNRRRKLSNLEGTRGRHRARVERGQLSCPLGMNAATPSLYSESLSAEYELRNQQLPTAPNGSFPGPTFLGVPPLQLPVAAPTPPAPVIIVHHWHQYCPTDGVHSPQNCGSHHPNEGEGTTEFAMGKEDEINGPEGNSGTNGSDGQNGMEEGTEKVKEEEEETTSEDSDYPVSDHDTADSNDFCSDNPDPAEEQLWNESCQKAAQSQKESVKI
ncbi:hypothetical protein niasHT_027551 [Heterodera trifolii]|uniref:Uncharacterized protein n=1 Tax=Heterodera trifolii TaxID=157864 RepID=A0ABD2K548_9BILA